MNKPKKLNEKQIVKAALERRGMSQKSFASAIGVESKMLTNQLNQNATLNLSTLYALLNALGYEIVVREKDAKTAKQEFVVSDNTDSITVDDEREEVVAKIRASMKPPVSKV